MKSSFAAIALLATAQAQDWQDTSAKTTVYSHTLKMNADNKFTILQLGDLMHNGYYFSETEQLIRDMVGNINPSLIVITGDTVDPAQYRNFKALYKEAMNFISTSGIPWLWTGGSQIEGLSRDQVLGIDQELNFSNSWSGYKWDAFNDNAKYSEEDLGHFTSRIPVMDKSGTKEVFSVFGFDTDDFQCSETLGLPGTNCIGSNAISWFMGQQIHHSHPYHQRDLLFMH